ncbi:hypothetical protein ABH14_22845 [Brevibacillus brevis]|nr:hypothetical protein [Brevibacillus brevis]
MLSSNQGNETKVIETFDAENLQSRRVPASRLASDHGQFQSLYRTKLIIAKKTPGKMPGVFLFEP